MTGEDSPQPEEREEILYQIKKVAMARLASRECSRQGLKVWLIKKDFPENLVEEVLAEYVEKKYLSDNRFFRAFVRDQLRQLSGSRKIQEKLKRAGILKSLSEIQIVCEQESDQSEASRFEEWLEKQKIGSSVSLLEIRKLQRRAISKGFSFELAGSIQRRIKS